jgi:hypothetical protein
MDEEGRATHEAVAERSGEMTCMDAGGRAPTVGALGDAGAIAEEKKSTGYIPSSQPSPSREKEHPLV